MRMVDLTNKIKMGMMKGIKSKMIIIYLNIFLFPLSMHTSFSVASGFT